MARKKTQSLEEWIQTVKTKSHGAAWKRLPQEALDEIGAILDHNDSHPGEAIPQGEFLRRIETVYGVKLSRSALDHYLTTELGRRWRSV